MLLFAGVIRHLEDDRSQNPRFSIHSRFGECQHAICFECTRFQQIGRSDSFDFELLRKFSSDWSQPTAIGSINSQCFDAGSQEHFQLGLKTTQDCTKESSELTDAEYWLRRQMYWFGNSSCFAGGAWSTKTGSAFTCRCRHFFFYFMMILKNSFGFAMGSPGEEDDSSVSALSHL